MIPGVIQIGLTPMKAPQIGLMAREKSGKSCLPITLFDWPRTGCKPLVLAFDETGPVSAAKIGHPLDGIVIKDQPGINLQAKMFNVLQTLEKNLPGDKIYTSLVIDCVSTMTEHLLEEIDRANKNPDPRSTYGTMNQVCKRFFWRVRDMGIPTIWICWLREPEIVTEKGGVTRKIAGGPQIPGQKFRDMFAGVCQSLVLLEKREFYPGDPKEFVCGDGQVRLFRTKSYAGINCESRFALPDPMPANLAWLLHYVMSPQGYVAPPVVG